MEVQLVSPEAILYEGEATMVVCRTIGGGDIAFLRGHAPFTGALEDHQVTVRTVDRGDVTFDVHGGFVEVSNDTVTILSDAAEAPA
ncbi:MAG: F0F1 ATP synthase subunit epsilon [Actinomycetota bacterium]|nr:F0F1 ATP synthase subunit epsilon [Acidimicrobiia bacterium]MDQ3292875.1 F0F1 ATP synthase subunit epsilon [Actinomycetota bacterium]